MNVEAIGAGATVRFQIPGRYFRLVETTGPVNVVFFRNGSEIAESQQVEAGYAESFLSSGAGFEFVEIYSATAQTIKFAVRVESTLSYDRAVGNVAVTNTGSAAIEWQAYALTTSIVAIRGANPLRRYLMMQNKSESKKAYFRIASTVGVIDQYARLGPGESFVMDAYCLTGSVFAVGDVAFSASEFIMTEA